MFDHVSLQVADLDASAAFYDTVLAPLGGARVMSYGHQLGYGVGGRPSFWIGQVAADAIGQAREVHLAFQAPDRDAVVTFYEAAVGAGAQVLYEPRVWPEYHPDYFGAFVRDPDGNNVEAVCHAPA